MLGIEVRERPSILKDRKKKNLRKNKGNYAWAYFMIAPTLIGLFILNIWPIIQTIYLSFCSSGDFGKFTWMGDANYVKILTDRTFWHATVNTFLFVLLSVPGAICLSLLTAGLLNSKIKGKALYRTIYFLPVVAAPAAIAMVWRWLYNQEYGLINHMLLFFGIQGPGWNTDPGIALASIAIVAIWSSVGYNMIILLAGLQNIPKSYYEAADIDGANPFRKYFSITLPLLSPTLFFVIVLSVMRALKQFDLVYMITGIQNPAIRQTRTLVYYFFERGFEMDDKAYASVIIVFLFLIIMLVTWFQFIIQKKWVYYN